MRVRPFTPPGLGSYSIVPGVNIPSRSHGVEDYPSEAGGSTPTEWRPTAFVEPEPLAAGRGGPQPQRMAGGWFTSPALFQLVGIPEGWLTELNSSPLSTLPAPFDPADHLPNAAQVAPPTPAAPVPSNWEGSLLGILR